MFVAHEKTTILIQHWKIRRKAENPQNWKANILGGNQKFHKFCGKPLPLEEMPSPQLGSQRAQRPVHLGSGGKLHRPQCGEGGLCGTLR